MKDKVSTLIVRLLFIIAAAAAQVACTAVLRPISQSMTRPGEVTFYTIADVQAEVQDWYALLVPANFPEGLVFDSAVFQVDVQDVSLIYTCANTRLFIVHQFGYNAFSVPPGLPSGYQAPSFQSLASGITVRGHTPGYAVHGIYTELSWLESDAPLVITLIAELNTSSDDCQLGRTELLDLGSSLESYSSN